MLISFIFTYFPNITKLFLIVYFYSIDMKVLKSIVPCISKWRDKEKQGK